MRDIQHLPNFISLNEIPKDFFKNVKKVLIIYSNSSKKNKLLTKLNMLLKHTQINYFNTSKLNFSSDIIEFKSKLFKPGYDLIISVGGGSVIDVSKLIYVKSLFSNWKKKIKENSLTYDRTKTKLIAISTLPGSGAEVSKTAVLNSANKKFFFTSKFFIPGYVFYDVKSIALLNKNKLTINLIDAILHSIESQNSILKNSFSETCANYVMANCIVFLRHIIGLNNKYFNYKEVKKLCIFSLYGGMAQSETGSGLCHALAHTLEKKFNIPHSESIFLCSMISLKYKRNHKDKKIYFEILKLILKLYKICFSKQRITKHNSILKKLNLDEFILNAKLDSCWKLEKYKIQETQLKKIFNLKIANKKWNI